MQSVLAPLAPLATAVAATRTRTLPRVPACATARASARAPLAPRLRARDGGLRGVALPTAQLARPGPRGRASFVVRADDGYGHDTYTEVRRPPGVLLGWTTLGPARSACPL